MLSCKKIFHHVCIQTNNYSDSLAFYQTLGFKIHQETTNFHGRSYNTWLVLEGFYIELQMGKKVLSQVDNLSEGIHHFCLYVEDLEKMIEVLRNYQQHFILKNGEIIYRVENGDLFKVKAPEGTIVEFRNNPKV